MNVLPENTDGAQGIENTENTDNSQSQNNNGNIGREVDDESESKSNKTRIGSDTTPNELGEAENQEDHWTGNYGQKSSGKPPLEHVDTRKHPKKGYNHVDNAGGTSQEDIDRASNSNDTSDTDDDEYGL